MLTHSYIIHAAVVQAAPVAFQRERTVEKVRVLTNDTTHRGAKLVVFPEAFISAYSRELSFGAVIGSRTPAGREEYRRYWESAVDVPGPTVATLSEIAAQNQVYRSYESLNEMRHALLYGVVLHARWQLSRQASQTHAHYR